MPVFNRQLLFSIALLILGMGSCKKSSYDIDYASVSGPYGYTLHGTKGDETVSLQWERPIFLCTINCPPIVRFDVHKYLLYMAGPDDTRFRVHSEYSANQHETQLTGLRNDEPYRFRILAVGARDSFSVSHTIMVVPGKKVGVSKLELDRWASQGAWSHDRQWLSFLSYHPVGNNNVLALYLQQDGQSATFLQQDASQAAWSPISNTVVYSSTEGLPPSDYWYKPARLMAHDVERGETRALTDGSHQDLHPAWSPDGRFLAFLSDRDGIRAQYNLWSLELETGEMKQLTTYGGAEDYVYWYYPPSWSPDGQHIAFGSLVGNEGEAMPRQIFLRHENGHTHRLWPESQWDDDNPVWSPDGRQLAFISRRTGAEEIWLYRMDSGRFTQLTTTEDNQSPNIYSKGHLSWDPDGDKLYFSGREHDGGFQAGLFELDLR